LRETEAEFVDPTQAGIAASSRIRSKAASAAAANNDDDDVDMSVPSGVANELAARLNHVQRYALRFLEVVEPVRDLRGLLLSLFNLVV
jgi:hypothetical protein